MVSTEEGIAIAEIFAMALRDKPVGFILQYSVLFGLLAQVSRLPKHKIQQTRPT
jgi:hypothetical protein